MINPRVLNRRTDIISTDAVYVGRPSKWGNPHKVCETLNREEAIRWYREDLESWVSRGWLDLRELRGKDLVCWCSPLPCHADVLLELANEECE